MSIEDQKGTTHARILDSSSTSLTLCLVIGARPNIPKALTVQTAFKIPPLANEHVILRTLHTKQHIEPMMSDSLAEELTVRIDDHLTTPSAESDIGHLAALMTNVDSYLNTWQPDAVLVVGDVNSAVAAALTAARNSIPVLHLEAGLRSHSREPEELNRRTITALADYHLAPSLLAASNLVRERIHCRRIHVVGNAHTEPAIRMLHLLELPHSGSYREPYLVVSVHKPATISDARWVYELYTSLVRTCVHIVAVVHPTLQRLFNRLSFATLTPNEVTYLKPIGYLHFAKLLANASCVITDSAGMQEEATIYGVPCVVVGPPTARPEIIECTAAVYAGYDIERCIESVVASPEWHISAFKPKYWDDQVSTRLSHALTNILREISVPAMLPRWKLRGL